MINDAHGQGNECPDVTYAYKHTSSLIEMKKKKPKKQDNFTNKTNINKRTMIMIKRIMKWS